MNYIPLEKKRKSNFEFMNSNSKKRRRMKPLTYGGDSRILPRVRELLGVQVSRYFDEDQLLLDLQNAYPEYRRKKKGDLKSAIKKAVQLYAADGANSGEGGSGQSFVNDIEFSPDERYAAYEDTKFSKKIYSDKREGHLEEKETFITHSEPIPNNKDVNMHSPETCAKDRRAKLSRNSIQRPNTKDSQVQKLEKTPKLPKKPENKGPVPEYSTVTFYDIGGELNTTVAISDMLLCIMSPPPGVKKRCGILLHGPPGCGKTLLARAIAGETRFPLIEVAATSLVSGISGDSESKIRNLFEQAVNNSPCILFIDEVETIASKREFTSKGMENRIVSQLLKSMDDLGTKHVDSKVVVIGATNMPDALDPAFRRGGRFDREIEIGIPDEAGRISILKVICKGQQLPPGFDFHWLAKSTPGYAGADLATLVSEAVEAAFSRKYQKQFLILGSNSKVQGELAYFTEKVADLQVNNAAQTSEASLSALRAKQATLSAIFSVMSSDPEYLTEKLPEEEFHIEIEDFQTALDKFVPCSKREGFADVPNTTWDDVGALKEVQKVLQRAVLWPVKYKEACEKFDYTSSSGILLWGPKGCGKTLLAKAIANESSINFLSVKGPELLSMYVGESERAVRQVFQRARNSAPCVVLFDELDALCPPRSNSSGNGSAERVVTQLLTEMNGMGSTKKIFVMGTTNRLENIDSAMLRPGRLEERIFVGLPTPYERVDILRALTKDGTKPRLADDVNLETLALDSRCDGFSGADLASLVRKATLEALGNYIAHNVDGIEDSKAEVSLSHFNIALSSMIPSVSKEEIKYFEMLKLSEDRKG